ncbi:hypothetical protein F5Y01DRAFT_286077 [Xylaria sp. FL0043]|nr:hypothetical protein F5Y01DRAFT_286077 [Xylaria sp. FL0043]
MATTVVSVALVDLALASIPAKLRLATQLIARHLPLQVPLTRLIQHIRLGPLIPPLPPLPLPLPWRLGGRLLPTITLLQHSAQLLSL